MPLLLPPQIFNRNSSALSLAEKVRFFLAKGPRNGDSQISPASGLQPTLLQINHLPSAPSLSTLSLKGGKKIGRDRETGQERHKEEKGTVCDCHPQLLRLGYKGAMATAPPPTRPAFQPPRCSVEMEYCASIFPLTRQFTDRSFQAGGI